MPSEKRTFWQADLESAPITQQVLTVWNKLLLYGPVKQIHVSVCSLWLINTSQSYTYLFVCILSLRTILVGNLPDASTKANSSITKKLLDFILVWSAHFSWANQFLADKNKVLSHILFHWIFRRWSHSTRAARCMYATCDTVYTETLYH